VWECRQLQVYLQIGLPNLLANSLEFLGFDIASFLAAYLGVNEEAAILVIMNILSVLFQVGAGL